MNGVRPLYVVSTVRIRGNFVESAMVSASSSTRISGWVSQFSLFPMQLQNDWANKASKRTGATVRALHDLYRLIPQPRSSDPSPPLWRSINIALWVCTSEGCRERKANVRRTPSLNVNGIMNILVVVHDHRLQRFADNGSNTIQHSRWWANLFFPLAIINYQ